MRKFILKLLSNKDFTWNMIGITFNSFYALVLIVFITRFNGIEESGIFSFTFYLASLLSIISSYGGRIYQISDIKNEYSNSTYVSLKFISSFVMVIVTILFCLFNNYDLLKFELILSFSIFRVFESIADSMYGIMQKHNRLDYAGKSLTLKTIIGTTLFIILDLVFENILISSISFIITQLILLLTYDRIVVKRFEKVNINLDKALKLLKVCFPIFIFTFLSILIMNTTRYIVDMRLTDEMQGYYGILVMPASIISLIAQFILQPFLVELSNLYYDEKYKLFNSKIRKINILLLLIGIVCLIVTYLFGSPVLSLIYGMNLNEFKMGLVFIVMAGIASAFSTIFSMILAMMRKLEIQIVIYLVSFFFSVGISYYFIDTSGIHGALMAFLFSMMVQAILFIFVYLKNINNSLKKHNGGKI